MIYHRSDMITALPYDIRSVICQACGLDKKGVKVGVKTTKSSVPALFDKLEFVLIMSTTM